MASRVAKYGVEFNFFAAPDGRIDNPPTKTKFMKFGEGIDVLNEIKNHAKRPRRI